MLRGRTPVLMHLARGDEEGKDIMDKLRELKMKILFDDEANLSDVSITEISQ